MTIFSTSSCCDDDDDEMNKTVVVEGVFKITNNCTGEDFSVSTNHMFDKDTLRIVFLPEEKYQDQSFTITCKELNSIGDSLFVLRLCTEDSCRPSA